MSDLKSPWRREKHANSLPEVFSSINIPKDAGFWRKLFAFAGPGLMIAVGYMDPGNWGTDLAGGSQFGYKLLWVILISNLIQFILLLVLTLSIINISILVKNYYFFSSIFIFSGRFSFS